MPARTITSVLAMPDAKEWDPDDSKAIGAYARIVEASSLYRRLAEESIIKAKESQLKRLNQTRVSPVEFKVGDHVSIYMPNRGLDANWRPKHCQNWAGPMVVVNRETQAIYEVEEEASGKRFRRHISNMASYKASTSGGAKIPAVSKHDEKVHNSELPLQFFVVGKVVAFTDEDNISYYHLGDVLELRGDASAKVHYRGTTTAKIKNARFIPVHVESPSGLSILTFKMTKRLLSAGCTSAPWTGVIDAEDVISLMLSSLQARA